ncbi:SDR family oxidoreductase [Streptomyces sp. NPDC051636]|uniref:SDR family oxidoreductase n=1 Tax=Streptomyces sp. NPDC051636 TaxID=3365663 RepID=UPI00378D4463
MTRWLVTGSGGMLGRDVRTLLTDGQVTALGRAALDITDPEAVRTAVSGHDVVINCAAWTDVDGAEAAEATATAVNGTGGHLAHACRDSDARLLHASTEYILPGDGTESAATGSVNAYGRSKLAGERAATLMTRRITRRSSRRNGQPDGQGHHLGLAWTTSPLLCHRAALPDANHEKTTLEKASAWLCPTAKVPNSGSPTTTGDCGGSRMTNTSLRTRSTSLP